MDILKAFFMIFHAIGLCYSSSIPKIIDLSYTYNNDTPNFPLHSKFKLMPVENVVEKYGIWIAINDLCTSEHSGTHIDAPIHFVKGTRTVDDIDPRKLYRVHGVKIDVRHKIKDNVNYPISREDIEEWIEQHGPLPDGVVVLFETGQGEKSYDSQLYSGLDETNWMNFPSLGKSGAEFLVSYKRNNKQSKGVYGVGLDVLSLDVGKLREGFPAHYALLKNDLYGIENVANVHLLPPRGFYLTISPMKIGKGSGGPTRIFAEISRDSAITLKGHWRICFISLLFLATANVWRA